MSSMGRVTTTMQPCAGFDNDDFVDFEAVQQYSISSSAEDWTLSELDAAALGIEQKTTGGGAKSRPEPKKTTARAPSGAVMKGSMLDAEDDPFSTARGGYPFNKTRPTMISAKYRLKEERRKVLKISINKLKRIEDPESSLRRSVLINNTMKRLQKEAREERREKQQINSFPRYTPSYKSFVLREDPGKLEDQERPSEAPARLKPEANKENASPFPTERKPAKTPLECLCDETIEELVDVTSLDEELSRPLEEMANPVNLLDSSRKRPYEEEPLEALTSLLDNKCSARVADDRVVEDAAVRPKRRCYDECDDSEIHDVLSQFYIPPTPRMLTSIDDEEEVNVVDIDADDAASKVPDFEELVSDVMDESPVPPLNEDKHGEYEMLACKRSRFESPDAASVFCRFQSSKETVSFETTSFGFLDSKRVEIDQHAALQQQQQQCETAVVGSVNCGTVASRRASIARISEAVSWTASKCGVDASEFKYNSNNNSASLGKTLSDCCYSHQETNNNNTISAEQKFSCAHAAIFTELQSQVYHNFVTSLES